MLGRSNSSGVFTTGDKSKIGLYDSSLRVCFPGFSSGTTRPLFQAQERIGCLPCSQTNLFTSTQISLILGSQDFYTAKASLSFDGPAASPGKFSLILYIVATGNAYLLRFMYFLNTCQLNFPKHHYKIFLGLVLYCQIYAHRSRGGIFEKYKRAIGVRIYF